MQNFIFCAVLIKYPFARFAYYFIRGDKITLKFSYF